MANAKLIIPLTAGAMSSLGSLLQQEARGHEKDKKLLLDIGFGGPNLQITVLDAKRRPLTKPRTLN